MQEIIVIKHIQVLCMEQCVFCMNAIEDAQIENQLEYEIDKLDFVAEKPKWEEMPPLRCRDTKKVLIFDYDDKKTYIWNSLKI